MLQQERPPCSPHLLGWSFTKSTEKENHHAYEYMYNWNHNPIVSKRQTIIRHQGMVRLQRELRDRMQSRLSLLLCEDHGHPV